MARRGLVWCRCMGPQEARWAAVVCLGVGWQPTARHREGTTVPHRIRREVVLGSWVCVVGHGGKRYGLPRGCSLGSARVVGGVVVQGGGGMVEGVVVEPNPGRRHSGRLLPLHRPPPLFLECAPDTGEVLLLLLQHVHKQLALVKLQRGLGRWQLRADRLVRDGWLGVSWTGSGTLEGRSRGRGPSHRLSRLSILGGLHEHVGKMLCRHGGQYRGRSARDWEGGGWGGDHCMLQAHAFRMYKKDCTVVLGSLSQPALPPPPPPFPVASQLTARITCGA